MCVCACVCVHACVVCIKNHTRNQRISGSRIDLHKHGHIFYPSYKYNRHELIVTILSQVYIIKSN